MRKACLGIGHCITKPDSICYNVVKQKMCTKYLTIVDNSQAVKSNLYRYKKERIDKASHTKTISKMDGIIRNMEDDGHNPEDLVPIIHMAREMTIHPDSDTSDDNSAYE